jgi:hypothetical protein
MQGSPTTPTPALANDERRWLHDKYERLAAEEATLADSRTSYFAAIASALVAAFVVLVVNELAHPMLMVAMATLVASFGIVISIVWTLVLHRTGDAQHVWREAAMLLESSAPPITTSLPATIETRHGDTIQVDLTQPYHVHSIRFSNSNRIAWIDRLDPSNVSANVPLFLVGLWVLVLVGTWTWFLST